MTIRTAPGKGRSYARDPAYGKPPQWRRLYAKHCPRETDPCSRHSRMIAEDILRDPKSPVRQMLIDAGYEPDHWASSIEWTIKALWEARATLWKLNPEHMQREHDRQIRKLHKRLSKPTTPGLREEEG